VTAEDLYDAKCKAIEHFKAPKRKTHLVAIEPAYDESDEENCAGWIAFYGRQQIEIKRKEREA
jgi:hypothetical protein